MGQGGSFQVPQLRPGLDPQRLDQGATGVLVGGQRLGRTTGEVPGPELLAPPVLPQRLEVLGVHRRLLRGAGLAGQEE